ncbi:MAG TPA: response regulator [Burkholderiales bacterium]|nr:response regulator [Burkholderiales bacterium]
MSRILIIEDNDDARRFMSLALQGEGYDVAVAEDGEAGLQIQRHAPAEVLITDIFMPNKDGIETIIDFRQKFPTVKIIAMSGGRGTGNVDYLDTAREIGADECLSKPFGLHELLTAVQGVIAKAKQP